MNPSSVAKLPSQRTNSIKHLAALLLVYHRNQLESDLQRQFILFSSDARFSPFAESTALALSPFAETSAASSASITAASFAAGSLRAINPTRPQAK